MYCGADYVHFMIYATTQILPHILPFHTLNANQDQLFIYVLQTYDVNSTQWKHANSNRMSIADELSVYAHQNNYGV